MCGPTYTPLTPMPQSLSAIERSNPPPRRKSCAACIKAKRRCTLEVPACQRCAQRNLNCIYPDQRNLRRRLLGTSTHSTIPAVGPDTFTPSWDPAAWNTPCLGGLPTHRLAPPVPDPTPIITTGPTACNFDGIGTVMEVPNLPLAGPPQYLPEMPRVYPESAPTKPDEVAISCTQGTTAATISWVIRTRLQYSIDRTRNAPRQMVLENQTQFCHPCLYEQNMPRSMQGIS